MTGSHLLKAYFCCLYVHNTSVLNSVTITAHTLPHIIEVAIDFTQHIYLMAVLFVLLHVLNKESGTKVRVTIITTAANMAALG